MTYEELLEKCLEEGGKVKQEDEVVKILSIVDALKHTDFSTLDEGLATRAIGKLSIYAVNLGQMCADADLGDEASKSFRKMKATKMRKEIRPTVSTVSDTEARVEELLVEDYERELINRYSSKCLENLNKSVSTLISVMQSRVKTLNSERARAGNQS